MTTTWPDHLIDLAEWDAMGEQERRFELVEGVLHPVLMPSVRHQLLVAELIAVLHTSLPREWLVAPSVELLVEDGRTPTVRVPDLVVLRASTDGGRPRVGGADLLAVVEVLSPGTRRVDRMHKLVEYAEVGIAHYLLVDPDAPVTATELLLVDGEYEQVGEHRGRARLDLGVPGGVPLDLDALDR